MTFTVINGNNIDVLKTYPDNHFDSIVTDPPYGIDFLGKDWDANTGALETYQECLRVLKPGGYLLAFSAARTYHHLAVTIERAGFEIRDQIMWIYSSGFPKSQDIGRSIQRSLGVKQKKKIPKEKQTKTAGFANNGAQEQNAWTGEQVVCTDPAAKQWEGWGTALKPAHEPICMARKPTKLTFAKNVEVWNTGALNIDATRISMSAEDIEKDRIWKERYSSGNTGSPTFAEDDINEQRKTSGGQTLEPVTGRFPSNVIGEVEQEYQKYFYSPKVSRKERHVGFEDPGPMFQGSRTDIYQPNKNSPDIQITSAEKKDVPQNNHPTVKPVALMEYLIKLVTPAGGLVLDPFNGSGSTGMAAVGLGYDYVGIDLDPNYVDIANKRIQAWLDLGKSDNNFDELFEEDYET